MTKTDETRPLAVEERHFQQARTIWDEGHDLIRGKAEDASQMAEDAHILTLAQHLARFERDNLRQPAGDAAVRMREALEPFARAADGAGTFWPDDMPVLQQPGSVTRLTLGDLRRARTALGETA